MMAYPVFSKFYGKLCMKCDRSFNAKWAKWYQMQKTKIVENNSETISSDVNIEMDRGTRMDR